MPVLEIISMLVDAGKTAYDIAVGLKQKKKEDKEKVSAMFAHVGQVLHETYMELNNGQYPHGHCRQLEVFALSIKQDFQKLLGPDADRLSDLLLASHQVEMLFGEINAGNVDKKELIKIEASSGDFIAASKLILF